MRLTILSTSDTHGFVLPTNYVKKDSVQPFGLTRAASVIQHEIATTNDPVITIDNGDFLEGSPLAYYVARVKAPCAPDPLMTIYNQIPYDVGILGNHEFNYGQPYLLKAIEAARRPFLCANILDMQGHVAYGQPYKIFERQGIKIAVLGLTTMAVYKWEQPTNISDLQFHSVVATAKEWVPKLHEMADVVIVSYHGGFERDLLTGQPTEAPTGENEAYRLLEEVDGIDALVTGHQHRTIATSLFGVPVTQPGFRGERVGKIVLELNRDEEGEVTVVDQHATVLNSAVVPTSPKLDQVAAPLETEVETWLDQPLAHINGEMRFDDPEAARRREIPYIELIQKVQMAAVGADISATALFNNEGRGFENPITMRNIMTNYVYPNGVAKLKITGHDLKGALEATARYFKLDENGQIIVNPSYVTPKRRQYNYDMYEGIDYRLNIAKPVGQRVENLSYHGKPIDDDQQLEIALNQYRALGGGHYPMYSANKIVAQSQSNMSELIADYLREHPQLDATVNHNFDVVADSD